MHSITEPGREPRGSELANVRSAVSRVELTGKRYTLPGVGG